MPNKHILIVTSNATLSHFLADTVLRPAEYQVTLAKDIQTAETAFRSYPPDLVILDAGIENGAGLAFAKKIIGYLPIVPVILATEIFAPRPCAPSLCFLAAPGELRTIW